jgi:hypothetical protein
VDVLIGNPPWLRYSEMTHDMQKQFRALSKERNLLTGGLGASARDLATLFVVRAVELYLKSGGEFTFVMPHGVLTRKPHTGFRSGNWTSDPWDLVGAAAATGFPMTSCVVHGKLSDTPGKMPVTTLAWAGKLSRADVPWSVAADKLTTGPGKVHPLDHGVEVPESPYKDRFRDGAIVYPLVLTFVTDGLASPLGPGSGRRSVVSMRSVHKPWRACDQIAGNVETRFIRAVYLGESALPFRMTTPREAVLPVDAKGILSTEQIELTDGFSTWWGDAEAKWTTYRARGESRTLRERLDHHGQLSAQFPLAAVRVVYTKTGASNLTAAIIRDASAVIDHSLYWMPAMVEAEAHYLTAILNSAPVLEGVKPLQAVGLFGPRHFDKNVFSVPFPTYDNGISLHVELAELGKLAEKEAATVDLTSARTFQRARAFIRAHLTQTGTAQATVAAVTKLLLTVADDDDQSKSAVAVM